MEASAKPDSCEKKEKNSDDVSDAILPSDEDLEFPDV